MHKTQLVSCNIHQSRSEDLLSKFSVQIRRFWTGFLIILLLCFCWGKDLVRIQCPCFKVIFKCSFFHPFYIILLHNSLTFSQDVWHIAYVLKGRNLFTRSTHFSLSGLFSCCQFCIPCIFSCSEVADGAIQASDRHHNTFWCGAKRKMTWHITTPLAWMDLLVTLLFCLCL